MEWKLLTTSIVWQLQKSRVFPLSDVTGRSRQLDWDRQRLARCPPRLESPPSGQSKHGRPRRKAGQIYGRFQTLQRGFSIDDHGAAVIAEAVTRRGESQ